MTWPRDIEQWREYASLEAKDIPLDLILAIIQHESGGVPGILANRRTKFCVDLPLSTGGVKNLCFAAGLMQTIPKLVEGWNKRNQTKIYYDDITGKDERGVRLQIRLGAYYLATCVNNLHRYDKKLFPAASPGKADQNQLQLALVAYARGFGALKEKLDILKQEGKPLTLQSLAERFPKWGYSETAQKWINRPVHYAGVVWNRYQKNLTDRVPSGKPSILPDPKRLLESDNLPILIAGLLLAIALGKKYLEAKEVTA